MLKLIKYFAQGFAALQKVASDLDTVGGCGDIGVGGGRNR